MRKVVLQLFVSLDGVAQAPGGADEDPSGGFAHGGWQTTFNDERAQAWVIEAIANAGAYLLGRHTYETFAGFWPGAPDDFAVIRDPMNDRPKLVASRTLSAPLGWNNSTLLEGDVVEALRGVKRSEGGDILMIGSLNLLETLLEADLVDEFRLMIHPLVLGGGKRVFHDDGRLRQLKLVEGEVTPAGIYLATYARA